MNFPYGQKEKKKKKKEKKRRETRPSSFCTQNPRTALLDQGQGARRRNRVILRTVEPRSIDSFPNSPRGNTTKKSIGKQANLVSGFCKFDPL